MAATIAWSAILTAHRTRRRGPRQKPVRSRPPPPPCSTSTSRASTRLRRSCSSIPRCARSTATSASRCSSRILHDQPLLNDVLLRAADGRLVATGVEPRIAQPPAPPVHFPGRQRGPFGRQPADGRSGDRPSNGPSCVPGPRCVRRGRRRSRFQPQPPAPRTAVCGPHVASGLDGHAGRSKRPRHGAQPRAARQFIGSMFEVPVDGSGDRAAHRSCRQVRTAWSASTATPSSTEGRGC